MGLDGRVAAGGALLSYGTTHLCRPGWGELLVILVLALLSGVVGCCCGIGWGIALCCGASRAPAQLPAVVAHLAMRRLAGQGGVRRGGHD